MKDIIIIGSGGHAKSIVDVIERTNEYRIVGFVDRKNGVNSTYRGYKIIGTDEELEKIHTSGISYAAVGIGYLGESYLRDKIYEKLKKIGFAIPALVDSSAIIASDVQIGEGTFVGKGAIINSAAKIGKMAIINSGAIIEHECEVNDYSHIAVGSKVCGTVKVGHHSLVGAGTTVIQGIKIGNNSIIGAGSVVLNDVSDDVKVYGTVR